MRTIRQSPLPLALAPSHSLRKPVSESLLADLSTSASTALYFSVPALYFLLVTLLRDRARTRAEADEFS